MQPIDIGSFTSPEFILRLQEVFGGDRKEEDGEYLLQIDNVYGKGEVRAMTFNPGLTLLRFDVRFSRDVRLKYSSQYKRQLNLIYISEGQIQYSAERGPSQNLDRYQNCIISPDTKNPGSFVFPANSTVRLNLILVDNKNTCTALDGCRKIRMLFEKIDAGLPFCHIGIYSLEIADQIAQIEKVQTYGHQKALAMEGMVYLIIAMQLEELQIQENNLQTSASISSSDLKKIHAAARYISNNISEPLSIPNLSRFSGLSSKKLQLGFKVLYSSTVNSYIKNIKMEVAREKLRDTDWTISEIVYFIGFKSRSYFSKIFKSRYGILPVEFRKKLKDSNTY